MNEFRRQLAFRVRDGVIVAGVSEMTRTSEWLCHLYVNEPTETYCYFALLC